MKKKHEKDLHDRAEKCRWEAENACTEFNDDAERKAISDFEKGEVADFFRDNAAFVTGLVVSRLNAVKAGKPTLPIFDYDADTLVRLLSTVTTVGYDVMCWNETLSDEDTVEASETDDLAKIGDYMIVDTPTTALQMKLRDALMEYARTAAAYAKAIGSASLLDWVGIVDVLENQRDRYAAHFSKDNAMRIAELEESAANRLRLDKIIAELPPFKPSKKAKKAK